MNLLGRKMIKFCYTIRVDKKLIIGLGNPGEKYKNNRHNVGHMFVDFLQKEDLPQEIITKKTDVFMNVSGELVRKIANYYKVFSDGLYIIHDDLDIPLGQYKIQKGKGPKLHYGIQSIENGLGTAEFWRIRIGVDNRDLNNRIPGERYVLEDFTEGEREILQGVMKDVVKELKELI